MLDVVADVATVQRSPDTRAIKYLEASGAAAISVTGKGISVGRSPDAFAVFWLPSSLARSVAARARNQVTKVLTSRC